MPALDATRDVFEERCAVDLYLSPAFSIITCDIPCSDSISVGRAERHCCEAAARCIRV